MLDYFKNTNNQNKISVKNSYLRIGSFCEQANFHCLHARRRQDMKEVYLLIYKNKLDLSGQEIFYTHLSKFIKKINNNFYDFGVDRDGIVYLVAEKNDTSLLANLAYNKKALENIIIQIIEIVSAMNAKGIFHGSLSETSFTIDTDKKISLLEPVGLNLPQQLVTAGNIEPEFVSLSHTSEVYSVGSLIYTLCTKESLPIFESKEQNQSFLKNQLGIKLSGKAPHWAEAIIKKCLAWDSELRFQQTKDLQKEISKIIIDNVKTTDSLSSSAGLNEVIDTALHNTKTISKKVSNILYLVIPVLVAVPVLIYLFSINEKLSNYKSDIKIIDSEQLNKRIKANFFAKGSYEETAAVNTKSVNKLRAEYESSKTNVINELKAKSETKKESSKIKMNYIWNLLQARENKICFNYRFK